MWPRLNFFQSSFCLLFLVAKLSASSLHLLLPIKSLFKFVLPLLDLVSWILLAALPLAFSSTLIFFKNSCLLKLSSKNHRLASQFYFGMCGPQLMDVDFSRLWRILLWTRCFDKLTLAPRLWEAWSCFLLSWTYDFYFQEH